VKTVEIQQTSLDACVNDAQSERIVVTRGGHPVALVLGVQGLDEEQIALGTSDKFWRLISDRRKEEALSRDSLEEKLDREPPKRGPI
jgi:hypothetical protein